MKTMLCLISYADVPGMYFNFEVDLSEFNREEIAKKATDYYNSIGEEEFLLGDTWTDDNSLFNKILLKGYTESFSEFLDYLEVLVDNDIIDEDDNTFTSILVYNEYNGTSIKEIVENHLYENVVNIGGSIRDFLSEKLDESEIQNLPSWVNSLIYQMTESEAEDFINNYEIANIYSFENEYYEIYN